MLDGDPKPRKIVLGSYEPSPPHHLARVYIVSSIRGILWGDLVIEPTFLPSPPGRQSCEVWTVIPGVRAAQPVCLSVSSTRNLNETNHCLNLGIISGESGSIVIDRVSHVIYGHIVASDPFGNGYFVPLAQTMEQISACLGLAPESLTLTKPRIMRD